ncbi:hypothetical protein [Emergencia sp.]|uniref:hypothetical protein n=1 Tax=Emergencia sp. TaxID=1926557 RepID=UPI003AF07BD1
MNVARIYFSDKSSIEVKEGDLLIPIIYKNDVSANFASMGEPSELWNHANNGLVPSILDVFARCDFFYLNGDSSNVYNSNSVVKISIE